MNNKDLDDIFEDSDIDEESYITLLDDNGNEVSFEVLDCFFHKDNEYIVLIPCDLDDDEVVIFEIVRNEPDDGGNEESDEEFIAIEDEELLLEVFEEFKVRNSDYFDFAE